MTARASLADRLRAHVPGPAAGTQWWRPPAAGRPVAPMGALGVLSWRVRRHRRTADLALVVAHIAVLVDAGCAPAAAVTRAQVVARGAVARDLAVVATWLREGLPASLALERWAQISACDLAARLAAATAAPGHQLAARVRALADELDRRVHDRRMLALQMATQTAWAAVVVALLAALR